MKVLLLHGPGKISSRAKLVNIKQKFSAKGGPASGWDSSSMVVFDSSADVKVVEGVIMTPSLLSDERLVIWENPPEDFILGFPLPTSHLSLLLWFDHDVGEKKPILDWVKKEKGEILFFPESKEVSVFPFLDNLANGNTKAYLEMEKLKKQNFDIFYFLTMSFYLLRNLVTTPKNAPFFVKDKLQKQRQRFELDDLTNLYKDLLEIEFKLKKGLLEISQAEFLLINKFKLNPPIL